MMSVTIAQLAARYGVTERSVLRWKSLGVNVMSPISVAQHVASQTAPRPHVARKILRILQDAKKSTPNIES